MMQKRLPSRIAVTLSVAGILTMSGCADAYLAPNSSGCGAIIVSASKTTLHVGETSRLTVSFGSGGGVATPCPLLDIKFVAFSTTNAGIASVTETYDVIGISPGTAVISVKQGTLTSAPITFHVIAP